MATIINADTVVGGAVITADASGVLELQSGGSTKATIDGTGFALSAPLPVASGGTGSSTGLNLATAVTGALGPANGGTGLTSPGALGNILTSDGTGWVSSAPVPSSGEITAVASGSLANGDRVIVNSNGTVSVVAATGSQAITNVASAAATSNSASNTNPRAISAVYGSKDNVVIIFYIGPSNYLYALAGKISDTTITFGTPTVVNSNTACAPGVGSGISAAYDYINNQYFCIFKGLYNDIGYVSRIVCTPSTLTISGIYSTSYIFGYNQHIYASGYQLVISPVLNGSYVQGIITFKSGSSGEIVGVPCYMTNSGQYLNAGGQITILSVGGALPANCSFGDSPDKCLFAFANGANYPTAVVLTLNGGSMTVGSFVQLSTNNASSSYMATGYSAKKNAYFVMWSPGTYNTMYGCAVTVSGTTITAGTPASLGVGTSDGTSAVTCLSYDITGDIWASYGQYLQPITLNGTSFTTGATSSITYAQSPYIFANLIYNNSNYTIVSATTLVTNNFQQLSFTTAYSTNLNANFIGVSSSSYSNGQTAKIKTVGSVASNLSNLTAGSSYYIGPDGSLSVGQGLAYAGIALSSTQLLIKG
jgi:hypothetical protein